MGVCVGVCLCKTNHSVLMCLTASLHRELAVTYSSGMDKTQEPISLVEGLNKDLSKLPGVWTTLQVIRASPTHSFSLSLRWPGYFLCIFIPLSGSKTATFLFVFVVAGVAPPDACRELRRLAAGRCGGGVAGAHKKSDWTCIQ